MDQRAFDQPEGPLAVSADDTAGAACASEVPNARPLLAPDLICGQLINFNTLDQFRSCSKAALLHEAGRVVWKDIVTGAAIANPALLTACLIISFADLKTYKFTYWAAVPACLLQGAPVKLAAFPRRLETWTLDSHAYGSGSVGRVRGENEEPVTVNQALHLALAYQILAHDASGAADAANAASRIDCSSSISFRVRSMSSTESSSCGVADRISLPPVFALRRSTPTGSWRLCSLADAWPYRYAWPHDLSYAALALISISHALLNLTTLLFRCVFTWHTPL